MLAVGRGVWAVALLLALGACGRDRCACSETARAEPEPAPVRVESVMIADAQRFIVAGGDAWRPSREVLEEFDWRLTDHLFLMATQELLQRGVDGWSRRYWGHHAPGEAPRIEVQMLCDDLARSLGSGLLEIYDAQDCLVHAECFPETKELRIAGHVFPPDK